MSRKNEPTGLRYLFYGIPEYNSATMARYKSILRHSYSQQARFRLAAVNHSQEFGIKAASKAFKVSRASLFRWRKRLKDSKGKLESLIPRSTVPKNKRQMLVEPVEAQSRPEMIDRQLIIF